MAKTVADMTENELRQLVKSVVEETLMQLSGNPDEGLVLREDVRERLLRQGQAVAKGERGESVSHEDVWSMNYKLPISIRPQRFSAKKHFKMFALFLAVLVLCEYLLYFSNPGHFFTTDTMFWFSQRLHSFPDFLETFTKLDPAGWYRPLTNRTVQSLLYPIIGLKPTLYHLLLFPIFLLNGLGVFYLAFLLTRRFLAAGIATLFFSFHTVGAYVTYDVAFFVELVYPFFYISGAIAALHYVRSRKPYAKWISLGCYVLALLSKEAAVTLPATIVVLCWFEGNTSAPLRKRVREVFSVAGLHLIVMCVYLAFVLLYLHVGGGAMQNVLTTPVNNVAGAYHVVFSEAILQNLDYGLSWAFNLPRGWHTQSRGYSPWMFDFLRFFRVLTVALLCVALFSSQRKVVLIGMAWFLIAVSPMLPLFDHFIPYYLYLALVGFSIVIGTVFDIGFTAAVRWPQLRVAALCTIFTLMGIVCVRCIRNDIERHLLLGASAAQAFFSYTDMTRLHPTLKPETTLYFFDEENPGLSFGATPWLFRVVYNDDTIQVAYSSTGARITEHELASGKLIAFKSTPEGRLNDVTDFLKSHPGKFLTFRSDPQHVLSLSADRVRVGQDSYVLTVSNLSFSKLRIFYTLDGEEKNFEATLDKSGTARFNVGAETPRGEYHFTGFQVYPDKEGFVADARITVQE